jgi:hypothetical protein
MNIELLTSTEIKRIAEYIVHNSNVSFDALVVQESIHACLSDISGLETTSDKRLKKYCSLIFNEINILWNSPRPNDS